MPSKTNQLPSLNEGARYMLEIFVNLESGVAGSTASSTDFMMPFSVEPWTTLQFSACAEEAARLGWIRIVDAITFELTALGVQVIADEPAQRRRPNPLPQTWQS